MLALMTDQMPLTGDYRIKTEKNCLGSFFINLVTESITLLSIMNKIRYVKKKYLFN